MKKQRIFGIDLLRIFSMYMIVILHVLGQGGILNGSEIFSLKFSLAWLLEIFCYSSVNCYAIISGYVMVDSKFKYKKILNLWFDVVFWLLFINLCTYIYNPVLVGKKDVFSSFFPVVFGKYWYFSSYFCLFLFIPFINKIINFFNKFEFRRLIITMVILFSFINIFYDPFRVNNGYSFLWLFICYFIGAYLKKYNPFKNIKKIYLIMGIVISVGITFGVQIILLKYPNLLFNLVDSGVLIKYNSITILLISLCLFYLFLRLNIANKYLRRFIKRLSPATFGVYIIHVHPKIWNLVMLGRFRFLLDYNVCYMIFGVLFFAFMIYMLCSYLEMIRIFVFKKIKISVLIDKIYTCIININKKYEIF